MTTPTPILDVRDLAVWFPLTRGLFGRRVGDVKAVDGVDLTVPRGGTLSLVGESGCGKTTTARAILRLVPATRGRVLYARDDDAPPEDLLRLSPAALRRRRKELQVVFQDPFGSLNPRMSIGRILAEPLRVHGLARGAALERRVATLLEQVGLGAEALRRFPHEFSGGQRQRIGIARALASGPRLLVCDEPVSALDVSIQAQILNLLADLQERLGLSYLFIAHDLSVVRYLSDRVAVMVLGRIVEIGTTAEIFDGPAHPFTRALLASAPLPDPRARRDRVSGSGAIPEAEAPPDGPSSGPLLAGESPGPLDPPSGCHFRTRCPVAEERCKRSYPALVPLSPTHAAACHLTEE